MAPKGIVEGLNNMDEVARPGIEITGAAVPVGTRDIDRVARSGIKGVSMVIKRGIENMAGVTRNGIELMTGIALRERLNSTDGVAQSGIEIIGVEVRTIL
jgi:hypothetical protein